VSVGVYRRLNAGSCKMAAQDGVAATVEALAGADIASPRISHTVQYSSTSHIRSAFLDPSYPPLPPFPTGYFGILCISFTISHTIPVVSPAPCTIPPHQTLFPPAGAVFFKIPSSSSSSSFLFFFLHTCASA